VITFTARDLAALKRALRPGRTVAATISATVADPAGTPPRRR
jgi:hypothetical protein